MSSFEIKIQEFLKKKSATILWLFLLTVVAVLLRGYKYRITFMLPYTYKYLDPSLFSYDIAFFNYDLNFFFYFNAFLSQFLTFNTLFFFGYLFSSFVFTAGVYYVSKTLFKTE